jgi:hypothetical protein
VCGTASLSRLLACALAGGVSHPDSLSQNPAF